MLKKVHINTLRDDEDKVGQGLQLYIEAMGLGSRQRAPDA